MCTRLIALSNTYRALIEDIKPSLREGASHYFEELMSHFENVIEFVQKQEKEQRNDFNPQDHLAFNLDIKHQQIFNLLQTHEMDKEDLTESYKKILQWIEYLYSYVQ